MWQSNKRTRWVLACAAALFCPTGSQAALYIWDNGGTGGVWSNANGWKNNATGTTGVLPTGADDVRHNNGTTLSVDGTFPALGLYISTAANTSGIVEISSTSTLNLARLYPAANIAVAGATNATVNQSGGVVNVTTQVWIGGHNGAAGAPNATGTYNLSGGLLNITASSANTRIGRNGSTGVVNQTGGRFRSNGLFISSQAVAGGNPLMSKGTYSVSGSAEMTLTGRLYVDSTNLIGDSNVTRGGDGTLNITGSAVQIDTYGYSQGIGGKLNFVADAGGISTIRVTQDLAPTPGRGETVLAGALAVDLSTFTLGTSPLVMIRNQSANAVVGAFDALPAGSPFGSYVLSYSYEADGDGVGNDVALLLPPPEAMWVTDGNGNWEESGNWQGGVPNGAGVVVNFTTPLSGSAAVTVAGPKTAGVIRFNSANSYTVAGDQINLDNGAVSAEVRVLAGSHGIASKVEAVGRVRLVVEQAADVLSLEGGLAAGSVVSKLGDGRVDVASVQAAGLSVLVGELRLTGTGVVSVVDELTVASGAMLNAGKQSVVVDYDGASPIAALLALYAAGQILADGDDGFGLPTYLAISEAADLGLTDFGGAPVDETAVLLKFTYVGDGNLDGQVDALDYERVDLAIGNAGVFGTAQGDLNYDGVVDALDYERIDLNIGNGVGSPLAGIVVPEPGSGVLLVAAIAGLAARRRARV